MKNHKNIVLVGFMGCGKTTVGQLLALALGYNFIDTDHLVESNEKTKISNIFENKGEGYFRKVESIALGQAMAQKGHVIATGGGIVTISENHLVLKKGLVFYLKATPQQIFENIKDDRSRPLLRGRDVYRTISTMMKERESLYQQVANDSIQVDKKTPEEVCRLLLKSINKQSGSMSRGSL